MPKKGLINWYAVYTKSRNEKKVAIEFEKQGIEYYLPLQKTLKQWSDRKKIVKVPLIHSYIFVYINKRDTLKVLQTKGVVTIVKFSGKIVPIPEWQINNLKILLGSQVDFKHSKRKFKKGIMVHIHTGILKGLQGSIIKHKGKQKLVISIDSLRHNYVVDINQLFVEPVK